jgi:hypothetical protein
MARPRVDKTHPKSFVAFIVEAINEVAPGHGGRVYSLALQRFQNSLAFERFQKGLPIKRKGVETDETSDNDGH